MMGRFTHLCLFVLFVMLLSVPSAKANDKPLIVELLPKTIEVDSRFNGTNIFLFGVKPKSGDIIITLRGPEEPMVVRRKRRAAGIWINDDSVAFRDVPQFYAFAATRPINELMVLERLSREQIGIDQILLNTIWIRTTEEVHAFRDALRKSLATDELYGQTAGEVLVYDNSLFRATLTLPANIPIGRYIAETLLIENGAVWSRHKSYLDVEKSGLSAEIYDFATIRGTLYGVIAIGLALLVGWAGSVAFRKK